ESNANMAFVLSGLDRIDARAVFLLPNGIMASGQKEEKKIREALVRQNLLLAVISLPGSMFESTAIPTCIMVFDKHKTTRRIAMFDLANHCKEEIRDQRGQFGGSSHTGRTYHKTINSIPADVMGKCLELLESGRDEEELCCWVPQEIVEENDFNLTPQRYIHAKIAAEHRPFADIAADYNRVMRQKNAIQIKMNKTAAKRLGYDCMEKKDLDLTEAFACVGQSAVREKNISFSADDGIQIKISTKDGIHPLVMDFLSHWKQMIIHLNSEENWYLAEFRDALLPELMEGKIKI
ncbi:MAG: N-6 DNA methylase, partial [bacterium]